jgi:hypothetical protein
MMTIILLFLALIILPNLIDYLKIGLVIIIEVLKVLVPLSIFPLMFWLIIYLNSRGGN